MSDYSGIIKETGRATHDEMRRLKQRLDYLATYIDTLAASLSDAHTDDGGIGEVPNIYLRLDASNDPVTGDLLLNEKLDVRNVTTLDPSGAGVLPLLANVSAVGVQTLAPDEVANPGDILAMWMEADDFAQADNTTIAGWEEKSVAYGPAFVQNSAFNRPHFRTNLTPTGKPGIVVQEDTSVHMDNNPTGETNWVFGQDSVGGDVNSAWILVYRTSDTPTTSEIIVGANTGNGEDIYAPGGGGLRDNALRDDNTFYTHPTSNPDIPDPGTGEWHCVLMWYDSATDGFRYWYDGSEYGESNPLTLDADIAFGNLFQSVTTGGTTSANVGLAVAAMVMYSRVGGVATPITLVEATKVHDYLALEYMGEAFTIGAGSAGNYIARFQAGDADKIVFRGDGKVGIGIDPPLALLHVNGDMIVESGIQVNGRSTFSVSVSMGDLTCVDLDCLGLATFTNSLSTWKLDVGSTMEVLGTTRMAARLTMDSDIQCNRGGKVDGLTLAHDGVSATNTDTSPRWRMTDNNGGGIRVWTDTGRIRFASLGGATGAVFAHDSSGNTAFCIGNAASSNFGISDASPTFKLDVNGDARIVTSLDVDGPIDINNSYLELDTMSAPATPATGHVRIYVDSSDGILKRIDDTGSSVSLEDTGGGGGGTARIGHWIPDLPLDTPAYGDDDFSTTSLTAINTWSASDPSGNHSYTAKAWGLEGDGIASNNLNLSFLTIPKPTASTAYTIVTKINYRIQASISNNEWHEFGIGIFEDVTNMASAGAGIITMRCDPAQSPDRISVLTQRWQSYSVFGANLGSVGDAGLSPSSVLDASIHKAIYLRVSKNGTTYRFAFSNDGRSWRQTYSGAVSDLTTNDTHIGFVSRSFNTPNGKYTAEFFRVIDGVHSFNQDPIGKRLDYLE